MFRKSLPALLLLTLFAGCAGHESFTVRSEKKLERGEPWPAWSLATKALDRVPGHPRARAAATAAADTIAAEWRRHIQALARTDTVAAAGQMLEFMAFRTDAARYATVPVPAGWPDEEAALREAAARILIGRGRAALESGRPKRAYLHLADAERFAPDDAEIGGLADRAFRTALTRVALAPLGAAAGAPAIGRDVVASWRGELAERVAPPRAQFTRILPVEDVERRLSGSQLDHLSRDDVIRAGGGAGADRVVWGTIGDVRSETRLQVFSEVVARRADVLGRDGRRLVRWVDEPVEVAARVRSVTVEVAYEVIDTRSGATLARRRETCEARGRVLWTTHIPQGSPAAYALIAEPARAADPERARRIEARWTEVAGADISLADVLEAKRASRIAIPDRFEVRARLLAGAAFVFLEELPPAEDLAFAAVAGRWSSIHQDLLRLDRTDDADLGLAAGAEDR